MPDTKPNPTGSTTVRLADVPIEVRRKAVLEVMKDADTSEYLRLFELVVAPGDAGGRIAA